MKPKIIGTIILFLGFTAFADGLSTPFDFEDTAVLPQGVRTIKIRTFTTEVLSKFDAYGNVQPIAKPFQQTLKFSKLNSGKSELEAKVNSGYMKSLGYSLDTPLGTIDAFASARVTVTAPVMGFGISDRHSIAVAIPIIYSNTYAATGFNISNEAKAFFGYLSQDTGHSSSKLAEAKLADPVNAQIQQMGYEPLGSETQTELGDIRLINKLLVKKEDNYAIALKQTLTLPTGKPASINKLVAVSSGDKQWDLGASIIADWYVSGRWTLSGYGGLTIQLADTTPKRIPVSTESSLGEVDPNTSRDLGDIISTGIAFKYVAAEGLTLATALDAQKKYSDIYHGNAFSAERYDWLSANTDQYMESIVVGVSYSTVPLFRKKTFPVPMDSKLSYSKVLSGKNVPADDVASAEVAIYF